MVTVAPQSLPMMRRKGPYRPRRPSRYKCAWGSGSGGSGGIHQQSVPPTNPHGSPNSLMQAAVARLALPRPHLVYIGSTGSIGRTTPAPPPVNSSSTTVTQDPVGSRCTRPRRFLDASVPVRLSSWTSSPPGPPAPPQDNQPLSPTPMTILPGDSSTTIAPPLGAACTTTTPRRYSRPNSHPHPRLRHHNSRGRKFCFRWPLGFEVGCAGTCLPGWEAFRTMLCYSLACGFLCGSLFLLNAYLVHVYNKEAMRNLLILISITSGLFAVTKVSRMRILLRLFDRDELKFQYRAGPTVPLFRLVRRRPARAEWRGLRCGDVTGRLAASAFSSGARAGVGAAASTAAGVATGSAAETDGGEADVEDDLDVEQNQRLVPPENQVPSGATDDDDDTAEDVPGALTEVVTDPDGASTSSGTPPPPPYATVVGSSSPPPSYDKVVQ